MNLRDIEDRERQIAAREGIDYDEVDRVWLRRKAIESLQPPVKLEAAGKVKP